MDIERHETCLADLSSEEIRVLITDLNARSETIGCVVFRPPGDHTCVTVIFAGNLERFFMVAAARNLRCPVIIFQDPISYWYQGSPILPNLDTLIKTVVLPEVGSARALLFGQSSGAYAALVASTAMPGASVVACAPQTRSDASLKNRIRFVGIRPLHTPEGLIDLRARLSNHADPDTMRAAVIAAGELDNPASAHWWGDYLHMLNLIDVPYLDLYVVHANTHVLAHGRVKEFARLLASLAEEIEASAERRTHILANFLEKQFASN